MSSANRGTKTRRLGAVRLSTNIAQKKDHVIPKLTSMKSSEGDMTGVTGNAMAVPPQKEKSVAREEKPKQKPEKSNSAGSSKSDERKENKELMDLKSKEKELLKQISALKKLIEELQDRIQVKDTEIEDLQEKLAKQEEQFTVMLEDERQQHTVTKESLSSVQNQMCSLQTEVEKLRQENQEIADRINKEWEEKLATVTAEKDQEIKTRDEKLSRLKMQMADALKGNSWERQQQLEELSKELMRVQEEADLLRKKLKSKTKNGGPCSNCADCLAKLEMVSSALKEKDVTIKDLKTLVVKFEKQLSQSDELIKLMAETKGHKS